MVKFERNRQLTENMKQFRRHSITQEIALIFITVMAGTIILCWVINNSFLEKFYIQNKKNAIKDAYFRMNEVLTNGDIT